MVSPALLLLPVLLLAASACNTSVLILPLSSSSTPSALASRAHRLHLAGYTHIRQLRRLRLLTACRPSVSLPRALDPALPAHIDIRMTAASVSWALDRLDQPMPPLDGHAFSPSACSPHLARRAHVFVIDSGCHVHHPVFLHARISSRPAPGSRFATGADANGHGTSVASLLVGHTLGVIPAARVTCVRVLDESGVGSFSDVAAALELAANANGAPVLAVLALAGAPGLISDLAVQRAAENGVVTFAAAGNNGGDACAVSPARAPEALAIAALGRNDRRARFSNDGPCVSAAAPGADVRVAQMPNAVGYASGTSFAAPLAAGVVALRWGSVGGTRVRTREATQSVREMLRAAVKADGLAVLTLNGRCRGAFVGAEGAVWWPATAVGVAMGVAGGAAAVVAARLCGRRGR